MTLDDNKILETLIEIKAQLAETNANMKNFQAILTNHENRIMEIEKQDNKSGSSFKDKMLELLGKGIVIALLTIGTLTGAGGIISKFFN